MEIHKRIYLIKYLCTYLSLLQFQNGVSLIWLRYEIPEGENRISKLSSFRESVTRVSLPAPARVARRSPCDSRLLVSCIDASVHVIHHGAGLTHSTRAGFVSSVHSLRISYGVVTPSNNNYESLVLLFSHFVSVVVTTLRVQCYTNEQTKRRVERKKKTKTVLQSK